jgi:hypothetical protein
MNLFIKVQLICNHGVELTCTYDNKHNSEAIKDK